MKTKAFIYIVIAGVAWGSSGIFVHFLAPYGLTSLQMTATRGTVALVCLASYILSKDRSLLFAKPKELLLYAAAGISLFFTMACYYSAMQLTSISTAVTLMYTSPILVMIFSVLFLGERFNASKLVSVILMFVGCMLVSGIIGTFKFSLPGILLGFGAGVAYTAYNVLTKIEMRMKCHAISATFYTFVFMTALAYCVSKPIGIVTAAAKNPLPVIPLLILLGICTSIVPYFLYTVSLKTLPVGVASALSVIEPMSATVFGICFGEIPDALSWIGIVMILSAVFLLSRSDAEKDEKEKTA